MYFTLCIFSAGLRTEEPFAMLSGKNDATGGREALGWAFSFRATRRGRPPWVEARRFSWQALITPEPLNPKPLNLLG